MKWIVLPDAEALARQAATRLLTQVREKPDSALGLPTGNTPLGMYARIVERCSSDYHCFSEVNTFNLDEYVGVPREHPGSYFSYMKRNLFDHVDIDPDRIHLPRGWFDESSSGETLQGPDSGGTFRCPGTREIRNSTHSAREDELLAAECLRYETEILDAGGLDLTILGLGRNGHIAFNEPGSPFDSRTRVVRLTESTLRANAPHFAGGKVPDRAITMGIATILESRAILLLAGGEGKADAIRRLESGEMTTDFPASALHQHPNVIALRELKIEN